MKVTAKSKQGELVEFESQGQGPIEVWEEARAAMEQAHGHQRVASWSCNFSDLFNTKEVSAESIITEAHANYMTGAKL